MSKRIGLRFISSILAGIRRKIGSGSGGTEESGYFVNIYRKLNKQIVSLVYTTKFTDDESTNTIDVVREYLDETSTGADEYSTTTASLTETDLGDSVSSVDGENRVSADRYQKYLDEASTAADEYSTTTSALGERSVGDTFGLTDETVTPTATLIIKDLQESASGLDEYTLSTADLIKRIEPETVHPREVGVAGSPWEEDPSKTIWTYNDFEKVLAYDSVAYESGRWLTGWDYRKSHEIIGSTTGALTDYQVKVIVHYGSGTDSGEDVYLDGKCRTDFGDIRFTESDGETEIPYWMEEKADGDYAVFWVKVPNIPESPNTAQIYIYYGNSNAVAESNGFYVFDFYEDAVNSRISYQPIIADTRWYGRPYIIDRGDGVWIMVYRDASQHGSEPNAVWHIRFSNDEGRAWTPDDTYIDGSPVEGFPIGTPDEYAPNGALGDSILIPCPNGDILFHSGIIDVVEGVRGDPLQWRSTDGGKTWVFEGVWSTDTPTPRTGQDFTIVGNDIYLGVFRDPGDDLSGPYYSSLYKSSDNGHTWVHVSDITTETDGTNELGIEYLGDNTLIVVLRDDAGATTYQRISTDLGQTWSSLQDIGSQVGVVQRPRLHKHGDILYMIGRHNSHTALFYSKDNGQHWTGPFYPDPTWYEDCGYASMVKRSDGSFYMLSYAGTTTDADIMEYVFRDDPPRHPGGAWSQSNITVSASDGYLRFYSPTESALGHAKRFDLVLPSEYMLMARYKTVSLGGRDQLAIYLFDGTPDHRFAHIDTPKNDAQSNWYYLESGTLYVGGGWTEGTEFIIEIHVDESDSATGIDYYRRDTDHSLLDSVENKGFALGSPVETDGINIGDITSTGYCDAYFRWIAIRKYVDPEPTHGAWGSEEGV